MKSSSARTVLFEDIDRALTVSVAPHGNAGRVVFLVGTYDTAVALTASQLVALKSALQSAVVQQAIARHLPRESVL